MPRPDSALKPDAGPSSMSMIGQPCTRPDPTCTNTDPTVVQGTCSSGERCIPATCGGMDNGFPGGYCSQACGTQGGACPTGSVCVTLPNTSAMRCLASCTTDSDCRKGYGCNDPTGGGGPTVCYPITPTGGTNNGAACVAMPTTLATAGFTSPNLRVPGGSGDVMNAEGNVDTDGQGRAAVSFTAIESSGTSGMGVAVYDGSVGGSGTFAATPQVFLSTFSPGFTSDPVVAWDRQASPPRLYLTWLDIKGNPASPGSDEALVAYSDGNGAPGTWSTPTVVSSSADTSAGFLDKPWIAARKGTVIVTYDFQSGSGMEAHIRVVRSSDGGKTWGVPLDADSTSGFRNLATPVLDAAGDLFVTWFEATATSSQIALAEQAAGASAFAPEVIASGTVQADFDDPAIAVTDDASSLWIAFTDNNAPTGDYLWATVSHDQGKTFSTPVQVNDDPDPKAPAPCATHYEPALAVDAAGRAHIAWYDNRYLQGNVMYAYSSGDTAFTANKVINDTEFPFTTDRSSMDWLGDYMGVAVDSTTVYAAWTDPRSGISHEYFAERPLE